MERGELPDGDLRRPRVPVHLVHDGDLRWRRRAESSQDDSLQLACRLRQERSSGVAGLSVLLLGMDALQLPAGHSPLGRGAPGKDRLRNGRLAHRHASVRESALRFHGNPHAAHPHRDGDQCVGHSEERVDANRTPVDADERRRSGLRTSNRERSPFFFNFFLNFS